MSLTASHNNRTESNQAALALDDGTGLRVVQAAFMDEKKFDWALFRGFQELRYEVRILQA